MTSRAATESSGRAPGQRVTINDIAARAGVSIGAVSYALNDRPGVSQETRDRIKRVAAEMDWAPSSAARSLSAARTGTVGLILTRDPQTLGVEQFFMRFISGVESVLGPRDYGLLLQVVPDLDTEIRILRKWHAARRVDGAILVDPRVDDPRIPVLSELGGLPFVVAGDLRSGNVPCVWTDDASAMRECVRFLASLGHRSIARVAGIEALTHTAIRDRTFSEETKRLGLSPAIVNTDFLPDQGAAATRSLLLADKPPTAIVYDNDVTALAGLGAAGELGIRVPEELSVVAWDDSALCLAAHPQLTALGHDVIGFGTHCANRLFDVIDHGWNDAELDSRPTLTVRASTAAGPDRRDFPAPDPRR